MKKHLHLPLLLVALSLASLSAQAQQKTWYSSDILSGLQKLNTAGRVLYIAAHPDDENTRLLSYLANEKHFRTAYLSVTRGDGGQNLIGTEQEDLLGIIRTQELLAARRVDGAEQFFTRAVDFGYSKTPDETIRIWNKEAVLSDMVWVIRKFRPDVILTRFPATGEGGHGHHTASAILAGEAFAAAADPDQYSWQLKHVQPWQAKKLLWNNFMPSRNPQADVSGLIKLDVGAFNPLTGKSYGELAAESRSMHKSQGFGAARMRGSIPEYFKPLLGDTSVKDLFSSLDFSLSKIPGTKNFEAAIITALKKFRADSPAAILPYLIKAHKALPEIKDAYWREQKRKELEEVILACTGLWFEPQAADFFSAPGETVKLSIPVINRSGAVIQLTSLQFPGNKDSVLNKKLPRNELTTLDCLLAIPSETPHSTPYWLRNERERGLHVLSDSLLTGEPEEFPHLAVRFNFLIDGEPFSFARPLVYKWTDPTDGERYRPFEILPPLTINFSERILLFTSAIKKRKVEVKIKSWVDSIGGRLVPGLPEGWKYQGDQDTFFLRSKGDEHTLLFEITAPATAGHGDLILKAEALAGNARYSQSISRIDHKHIPHQVLLQQAEARLVPVDLVTKGKKIGYIPGPGDEVAACISQMGYEVILLNDKLLETYPLDSLDAIVTGIRLYNTSERMKFHYQRLMSYVKQGGTMVVQYNTSNFLSSVKSQMGPYPFKISRERVTVEEAPVIFDSPDHPVLSSPNKITAKDFEGWIQERGLYFASEWDSAYTAVLAMNDPGEKSLKGSLLIAPYGRGHFIYTGLAFFRQLPAGVPGAYRLFANLISRGGVN